MLSASSEALSMHWEMAQPCIRPRLRVLNMSRSKVPCKSSVRSLFMSLQCYRNAFPANGGMVLQSLKMKRNFSFNLRYITFPRNTRGMESPIECQGENLKELRVILASLSANILDSLEEGVELPHWVDFTVDMAILDYPLGIAVEVTVLTGIPPLVSLCAIKA